ncbi:OmpP1/FadL family transporter [Thermocrinis sp.]|uniref:OmpP1/FadL family transporter n=1 Tax=Thermocrinis sp. TaxID=2024383 RepID=UPI003C01799D
MRKLILASAMLGAVSLSFATNGDNLIGVSPASRGMGGIGVGMPVGPTDTIFRNSAWMSYYKGFNMSFGGILLFPEVKAKSNVAPPPPPPPASATSQSKMFVVPEVGIVNQINDKLTFGIGAFGVSGMGVDYRNKGDNFLNMHTTFQFMRVIPTLAYKVNDAIYVSGAVHLAYGSLDMGATIGGANLGGGQSQTYGIGAQLGIAYNMGDFVYAGLTYQSPVNMTYKRVFDFDCLKLPPACDGQFEDFKLTQPQELAFGIGVKPMDNLKVGMDIRWINWKNAKGYKEFQWKDQWVIAFGGEFKPTQKLALRTGYNYGRSPIRGGVKNTAEDFQIAVYNLTAFPAITEHHITLGLGYEFTKNFSIDLAYKHAFKKKVSATYGTNYVEAQNAQNAISIGLNWKF